MVEPSSIDHAACISDARVFPLEMTIRHTDVPPGTVELGRPCSWSRSVWIHNKQLDFHRLVHAAAHSNCCLFPGMIIIPNMKRIINHCTTHIEWVSNLRITTKKSFTQGTCSYCKIHPPWLEIIFSWDWKCSEPLNIIGQTSIHKSTPWAAGISSPWNKRISELCLTYIGIFSQRYHIWTRGSWSIDKLPLYCTPNPTLASHIFVSFTYYIIHRDKQCSGFLCGDDCSSVGVYQITQLQGCAVIKSMARLVHATVSHTLTHRSSIYNWNNPRITTISMIDMTKWTTKSICVAQPKERKNNTANIHHGDSHTPKSLFLKENGCGYWFLLATRFKHHKHSLGLQSDDFTIQFCKVLIPPELSTSQIWNGRWQQLCCRTVCYFSKWYDELDLQVERCAVVDRTS